MKAAIAVLLLLAHGAVASPFKKMPKKAAAVARKLVTAVEADDSTSFVALLPEDAITLDGAVLTRTDVQTSIAVSGADLVKWLGATHHWKAHRDHGAWVIETREPGGATTAFTIGKRDGAWQLGTITRTHGDEYGHGGDEHMGSAPASVLLGKLDIAGKLSASKVRAAVKRDQRKITYCYEKELAANPELRGIVKVHFTIEADGTVSDASAIGMEPVDACLAEVFRAMTFPHPDGGGQVVVTYPIHFEVAK